MARNATVIEDYLARLKELGEQQDHINRFYVAMTDDELLGMEEQLIEHEKGLSLHEPVLALYRLWKDEIGPVKWAQVWAHNESLGDADRNWLMSEEMGERVS